MLLIVSDRRSQTLKLKNESEVPLKEEEVTTVDKHRRQIIALIGRYGPEKSGSLTRKAITRVLSPSEKHSIARETQTWTWLK